MQRHEVRRRAVSSKRPTWIAGLWIAGLLSGCQSGGAPAGKAAAPTAMSAVDRGRYLSGVLGCNDCHTPLQMGPNGPVPDLTRLLSGHPESLVMPPAPTLPPGPWMWIGAATNTAYAGPWGVTYAANLTPDQNTGLGIWTEDMFIRAIREGKHMGTSRTIQPPMPWQAYAKLEDADVKALFAYLKSIPPISNHVPDWQPPGGSGN